MSELISTVITTYARPFTLRRAIDSIISQNYKNLEIIIVDDNKDMQVREEVKEIVSSYSDPRLILICNNKNLGGALSRNVGIKASNGDYIAFLDDDDEYYPDKITKQYELMKNSDNPKLALVYCYCEMINASGNVERVYRYQFEGNCVYEGMYDCIAATSQWLCSKSALVDVGCFSDVPCKQDSNLIVKLLVKGYEVDYVSEVLSKYYRDAGEGISTSGHEKRISGEEALRELCRSHYSLLNESQRKEIEYSFSCRLIGHYYATNMKCKFYECLKSILFGHPFSRKSLSAYKNIITDKRR